MARYNPRREGVVPTEVNLMGEKAYKLSPKEEFVATILTTFLQKSYYETEPQVTQRIITSMSKVDPLFAAKAAIYARDDSNMRTVTHLIAGELAARIKGEKWAKRFYRKIAVRPDDMAEIVGYYKNVIRKGKSTLSLPNSMKKGFREKLESMDPYLIDKYKMNRRDISLIDLVRLFHPKPTQANAEAYNRLRNGKSLEGTYSSKILEKEMSKAGQNKTSVAEKNEAKGEAIASVLDNVKGMPVMNLLRNLRNILLYAPEQVEEACNQLVIRKKIQNSRLLPFRFLSAYEEISKMTFPTSTRSSTIAFESDKLKITPGDFIKYKKIILEALEEAMKISCENIPKLEGTTAILIDHSGSMRGGDGGTSLVSAYSTVTTSMIANLFGTMLMMSQDNVYVGLFGDKLIAVNGIDRSKGILENAKAIHTIGGGVGPSSEHGIYAFFNEVVKGRVHVDNVIVFSDMVIGSKNSWYGKGSIEDVTTSSGTFQELFKKFRRINPICNVVSVDIKQTSGTSVFDKSLNVTQIAGWSTNIFDHIKAGTAGYKDIIEAIEAIEI